LLCILFLACYTGDGVRAAGRQPRAPQSCWNANLECQFGMPIWNAMAHVISAPDVTVTVLLNGFDQLVGALNAANAGRALNAKGISKGRRARSIAITRMKQRRHAHAVQRESMRGRGGGRTLHSCRAQRALRWSDIIVWSRTA
jgi:hypothetical protein